MTYLDKIKQWIHYDPNTGVFTWKHGRYTHVKGKRAGNINKTIGYRYIRIDGTSYRASRLAWLIYYGEEPKGLVDHINRIRADDRIANLRVVTRQQNSVNNSIKMRGIYLHGNKWKAQLKHNKKTIYLGLFPTINEAYAAVVIKHKELYGEFSSCE
jgi:hypothetical protein